MYRRPQNHIDDCYLCLVSIVGINGNNRNAWTYPYLVSARCPIPHIEDVSVPKFHQLPELCEDDYCLSDHSSETNEGDRDYEETSSVPKCFNHGELKDLTRDINLSKEVSELLTYRLKEKILTEKRTKIIFYRTRETNLLLFFSQKNNLVFHHEILEKMGLLECFPDY